MSPSGLTYQPSPATCRPSWRRPESPVFHRAPLPPACSERTGRTQAPTAPWATGKHPTQASQATSVNRWTLSTSPCQVDHHRLQSSKESHLVTQDSPSAAQCSGWPEHPSPWPTPRLLKDLVTKLERWDDHTMLPSYIQRQTRGRTQDPLSSNSTSEERHH